MSSKHSNIVNIFTKEVIKTIGPFKSPEVYTMKVRKLEPSEDGRRRIEYDLSNQKLFKTGEGRRLVIEDLLYILIGMCPGDDPMLLASLHETLGEHLNEQHNKNIEEYYTENWGDDDNEDE